MAQVERQKAATQRLNGDDQRVVNIPVPKAPAYDEAKFKELILYVAERCADDPTFGDTKLNKILFFSDFLAYGAFGKPITGAVYQKLEYGPAPRRLLPVRNDLIDENDAQVVQKGRTLKRTVTVNRREADTRFFDTAELDLVNEVIELLQNYSATEVSELSHKLSSGWQLGKLNEDIPYDSVFLSMSEKLSATEFARGQQLAADYGLTA